MLPALALAASLAASGSDARTAYEVKCLFCHSAEVAQRPRLRPWQWRRLVESMRRRAPLLISRRDVEVLTRYIVHDLKLVPPRRAADPEPPELDEEPIPLVQPEPASPVRPPEPLAPPPLVATAPPVDEEAERLGPDLLEAKCSKCHTLQRVFLKVDTLERGSALLERMRKKTGSGITRQDADLLLRFLQSRM